MHSGQNQEDKLHLSRDGCRLVEEFAPQAWFNRVMQGEACRSW